MRPNHRYRNSATRIRNNATGYSESDFQQEIRQIAALYGWADYCTLDSRHSPAGWPDLTLIRPPHIIFAELKSPKGRLTPPQVRTINLLSKCERVSAYRWRPEDYADIGAALGTEPPLAASRSKTHKTFQAAVRRLATDHGWADYCVWNSRKSPPGWPDLTLVRPPEIIFAELKVPPDRLTPAQERTLQLLAQCEVITAEVWRPDDWQRIADTLFRPAPVTVNAVAPP